MKRIFVLITLILVQYYWIIFFRFCHPYPKSEYFTVIGVQFFVTFIAYLYSQRIGRIITIISGLTLVRIATILGIQTPIVTLMGVFWGAVFGIFIKEIIAYFQNRDLYLDESQNSKEFLSGKLVLILFLILVTLERFINYFNAPFLNGFGILETMYVKNVSSKEAFALSMESITHIFFPLLYFYAEEINSKNSSKRQNDWKIGVLIGLAIQVFIMLLQIFWNRNILSENTNLSLEANRVMGLFRDSGSSTWILPVLGFLFYYDLLYNKRYSFSLLIGFIFLEGVIGFYQGRGYWLLFFISLFFLGVMTIQKKKNTLNFRKIAIMIICTGVIFVILYTIPKEPTSSLAKLLSIPEKIIDFLQTGNTSSLIFDPHRFYFNLAAWNIFIDNPFFGSGFGSFIVNLKDPYLLLYTPEGKIDNPAFILGIISELGFVGIAIIILSLHVDQSFRDQPLFFVLLFFAFSFGYHIVQADGGFVAILVLVLAFPKKNKQYEILFKLRYYFIVLFALFILSTSVRILPIAKIFEFRKEKISSFQLLAFQRSLSLQKDSYHIFKGKTAWVLAETPEIKFDIFLDNTTSRTNLMQKWSFWDKNNIPIFEFIITIKNDKSEYKSVRVPDNAYYIQVEELDEKGRVQFYGDVPFCIPVKHFTKDNKFL